MNGLNAELKKKGFVFHDLSKGPKSDRLFNTYWSLAYCAYVFIIPKAVYSVTVCYLLFAICPLNGILLLDYV